MPIISIPSSRALDPALAEILGRIDVACTAQGVPYLLTGAMAREILLVQVYGLPPGRATRDVDFGVLVKTWAAFTALKAALVESGDFVTDHSAHHRLYTVPERLGVRVPVDLVPFGGVETPRGTVAWPPDGEVVMDVRGYEAARNHALQVQVRPGLVIPLPSAQSIVVMKILAWKDRGGATRGRDAIDLVEILERAEDILGLDVLYDEYLNVVETWGGDLRLAAAWILGAQARVMVGDTRSEELAEILIHGKETTLILQVLRGRGAEQSAGAYEAVHGLVNALITGLQQGI